MNEQWIWKAIAVGFAALWLVTFTFGRFKEEMVQTGWALAFRQDTEQFKTAVAQEVRELGQRLQALERRLNDTRGTPPPGG